MNRLAGLVAMVLVMGGSMQSSDAAGLKVQVRRTPAGPQLYVNGSRMTPTVLFVNLYDVADAVHTPLQLGEVEAAGRHGVDIVSLTIGTPWPRDGETPDYEATADRWIQMVLKANPKALVIPRILVTAPPDHWFAAHPDERMLYDDGKRGLPSVHSVAWRHDAAEKLGALVAHLEQRFGDHILAYHPSGQHTGEWFYDRMWEGRTAGYEAPARAAFRRFLKARYPDDSALRLAWNRPGLTRETAELPTVAERMAASLGAFRDPAAQRPVIDFDEFLNVEMADTVQLLCHAIKRAAPNKLSVAFYGYHYEMAPAPSGMQTSGHLALHRLLQSPDVDILCSPQSYFDRGIGGGGYFMAPVDSVQLHGKLWLVEDDTRTHLSAPDSGYGRPDNFRQTRGVLARNFGHIATHGTAVWWMDLPGEGWFAGDEMWQYLSILDRGYTKALETQAPYRPEVAVILDEESPLVGAPNAHVNMPLLYQFRAQLYRMGAPTGLYLLDDLVSGKVPPARLTIILNAFRLSTAQVQAIQRRARRRGCVTLFMYAPGYIRGDMALIAHIEEVTGIVVRPVDPRDGAITDLAGKAFDGAYSPVSPSFAVADLNAQALAYYGSGRLVAVAAKPMGGGLAVYSGALQLPASMLRDLARKAGVHLYNEQDDVVMAGSGWVGLHAVSDGVHSLRLPRLSTARDIVTGETFGPSESLSFEMLKGDTRLLRVTPVGATGKPR